MARNRIRLEEVVNNYMARRDEDDTDKYVSRPKMISIAKSLLRDISYSGSFAYRAIRLDINTATQTVELPNDFIKISFVGVFDEGTGTVVPLGTKQEINIAGDILRDNNSDALLDSDGVELLSEVIRATTAQQDDFYTEPYFNRYYNNFSLGGQYGQGGGNNVFGYYRFNEPDNRLELDLTISTDKIVLEYQADVSIMENPLLDPVFEGVIHEGMYWKAINHKANVPANAKFDARREYYRLLKNAISTSRQNTKQEYLQQFRKNTQATPKY